MRRLLGLLAFLAVVPAAHATTLVNDPAHPFSEAHMAQMQRWVAASHVPAPPGTVTVSNGGCPNPAAIDCAEAGHIYAHLVGRDARYTFLHELGHEDQMLDGPGAPDQTGFTTGWAAVKITALASLLNRPADPFWGTPTELPVVERPLAEVSADAYAECAMHTRWVRWWEHRTRAHDGARGIAMTATNYDFRAGPKRFIAICAVLRRAF